MIRIDGAVLRAALTDVLDRVAAGERVVVTRPPGKGAPVVEVAALIPLADLERLEAHGPSRETEDSTAVGARLNPAPGDRP